MSATGTMAMRSVRPRSSSTQTCTAASASRAGFSSVPGKRDQRAVAAEDEGIVALADGIQYRRNDAGARHVDVLVTAGGDRLRRADDIGERQHPTVRQRPVVGGVGHALEFAEERHFGKEGFVGHGFHIVQLSTDPCCHCNANSHLRQSTVARFHVLEHFVLFRTYGNALSFCFYAIPDAKPLSHFCWNCSRTADDFMTDID